MLPPSSARQSAGLRLGLRNAFTHGAWGGRKQTFQSPKFFSRTNIKWARHRGGEGSFLTVTAHLPAGGQGGGGTPRPTQDGCLSQPKLRAPGVSSQTPPSSPSWTTWTPTEVLSLPFLRSAPSFLTAGTNVPAPNLFQLPVLPLQATPWYPERLFPAE